MGAPLKIGHHYKRKETHVRLPDIVGTQRVTYLVQAVGSKRLVSGWLNRQMDPDAPREIWVQDTDKISERATRLFRQGSPVHVFVKESKEDAWSEYLGEFRAAELWDRDTHGPEIRDREELLRGTPGERALRHVLVMEPVVGQQEGATTSEST